MFSRIFYFFLISCLYSQINCAPERNRDEDSDFTFSSDKDESYVNDEHREVKDVVDIAGEDARKLFNDNYQKSIAVADRIALDVFKEIDRSVGDSLDKNLQSAGEFFDAGWKNSAATISTIFKKPWQQSVDFVNGFFTF